LVKKTQKFKILKKERLRSKKNRGSVLSTPLHDDIVYICAWENDIAALRSRKTLHLNYSARARLSLLKNKISLDSERTSEYENSKFKTSFENEDEETSKTPNSEKEKAKKEKS